MAHTLKDARRDQPSAAAAALNHLHSRVREAARIGFFGPAGMTLAVHVQTHLKKARKRLSAPRNPDDAR